jgi:hypothetical protein
MHIHGVSFHVMERNGQPPPAEEQGAKDVVLIGQGEQVKLIMRFDHPTDGWPFMYHCHNLMHEDNMMMLQFIVTDINTSVHSEAALDPLVYPVPTHSTLHWRSLFPVDHIRVLDLHGRLVSQGNEAGSRTGVLDLSTVPAGIYLLEFNGAGQRAVARVVRDGRL